jgi:hypothetical protein
MGKAAFDIAQGIGRFVLRMSFYLGGAQLPGKSNAKTGHRTFEEPRIQEKAICSARPETQEAPCQFAPTHWFIAEQTCNGCIEFRGKLSRAIGEAPTRRIHQPFEMPRADQLGLHPH